MFSRTSSVKADMATDAMTQKKENDEMDAKFRANGLLERFREELGELASHPYLGSGDARLLMFLRADGGDLNASLARLRATIKWHDEVDAPNMVCNACIQDPHAHYMHQVGVDKLGRPVIYSCIGLARDRARVSTNMDHIVETLERMIKGMGPGIETYVWLSDFHGFELSDCNPRISLASNNLFSKAYPERMGHMIFLDSPVIFSSLFAVVKPVVDKRTARKLRFLDGPRTKKGAPLRAALSEIFDEELVEWTITEMLENRDPKKAATKSWRAAEEANLRPGMGHDLRGPPSRIAFLNSAKNAHA